MKPLNPKTMNWIYIFFKHGWAVFGALFLLVLMSVFVQIGPDPVILQWDPAPMATFVQKFCLALFGVAFVGIAIFRFYESAR